MRAIGWSAVTASVMALGSGVVAQQTPQTVTGPEVTVTGLRDIVVHGRARDCTPLPDDPLNKVDVRPRLGESPRQSEIARLANGQYLFRPADEESITGPDFWTRTGTRFDQYVFRVPKDGQPMCIGAHTPDRHSWGQLRQIVDATPYRGKRVRFTLWVATGDAELVRFWLVAAGRRNYVGGHSKDHPWGGNHGWTPVMLEIGPISPHQDHISYGFLLYGHGAVWAYQPQLEVVTDQAGAARKRDLLFIGGVER